MTRASSAWRKRAIRETLYEKTDPAAAVISINPANGAIRAMTAVTPGTRKNQFNLLSQARRQAGSTFKTFVLAAAVDMGVNPDSTYYVSAPFYYQPDTYGNCEDGSWWCVETYSHSYDGTTSIARATLSSDNTVFAQLTLDVTPERVGRTAKRLGVQTELRVDGAYVPSMGLGSIAVSPLDMASAYATLAAGGVDCEPMAIRKVVLPDGTTEREVSWGKKRCKRVLTEGEAYTVTEILEENVQFGTGTGASYGHPAAGKTGTTDDHADAWFCGYTPRLQTTVWVGLSEGRDPDGERARDQRHRRQLPGRDLAPLHGRGDRPSRADRLRDAGRACPSGRRSSRGSTRGRSATIDDDDDYYAPPTSDRGRGDAAHAGHDGPARGAEAASAPAEAAAASRLHRRRPHHLRRRRSSRRPPSRRLPRSR